MEEQVREGKWRNEKERENGGMRNRRKMEELVREGKWRNE
jgi:hypothetical protein